jgi:hypothetical protein
MSSMTVGTHVYVNLALPGWGEVLDRYGVIEKVAFAHLKFYVRTKLHAGWVRLEDLVAVRGNQ